MSIYTFLAEAFSYPFSGQIEILNVSLEKARNGSKSAVIDKFIQVIEALSLAEREELYTRTLDLSPLTAPYVGYQLWKESYKRGAFMSELNHEMNALGIDKAGELPDHLIPVLRYLDAAPNPLPALLEALPKALKKMRKELKKAEPQNPYRYLLAAISPACQALPVNN